MNLRGAELPRPIPAAPSRATLLYFIRAHAPDLRIRKQRLEDGRRACGARFTFRGQEFVVEAVESPALDPDDAVVRRCAWLIYRGLGIRTHLEGAKRDELEQNILGARGRGDNELADRLGLELVLFNEDGGRAQRPAGVRPRFEQ